ncbi:MAG: hypothetical protein OEY70_17410 [Acidimicrobiia bacterium]|nr:hypothetical protein [Acidimicrobiia bacterium]
MAKKVLTLDTPFRPGEKVIAATEFDDIQAGTRGKIQLANGLGEWRRYWVKFAGGKIRGQVSHEVLARPDQLKAWQQAQEAKAEAALRKSEPAAAATGNGDAPAAVGGGVASRIPAAILERSKAAKARTLGG